MRMMRLMTAPSMMTMILLTGRTWWRRVASRPLTRRLSSNGLTYDRILHHGDHSSRQCYVKAIAPPTWQMRYQSPRLHFIGPFDHHLMAYPWPHRLIQTTVLS